jgi:hypothetical protein
MSNHNAPKRKKQMRAALLAQRKRKEDASIIKDKAVLSHLPVGSDDGPPPRPSRVRSDYTSERDRMAAGDHWERAMLAYQRRQVREGGLYRTDDVGILFRNILTILDNALHQWWDFTQAQDLPQPVLNSAMIAIRKSEDCVRGRIHEMLRACPDLMSLAGTVWPGPTNTAPLFPPGMAPLPFHGPEPMGASRYEPPAAPGAVS